MKVLLDENIPLKFRNDLLVHEVYTVYYMGWLGVQNGELLTKMLEENFEVLISFDQHIGEQQNFNKYSLPVLVIQAKNNSYATLKQFTDKVLDALRQNLPAGVTVLELI